MLAGVGQEHRDLAFSILLPSGSVYA